MVEKKDDHAYVMDLYKTVGDDPGVTALGCKSVFDDALKLKERIQELLPAVLTWSGASWAKNREKADLELTKFQTHSQNLLDYGRALSVIAGSIQILMIWRSVPHVVRKEL